MPARDYQPTMRALLHKTSVYIGRHRMELIRHMTPEQRDALIAFEEAARKLQEALGPIPYEN